MSPQDSSSQYPLWKAFLPIFGILAIISGGLFILRSFNDHHLDLPPLNEEVFRIGEIVPDFSLVELKDGKNVVRQLSELKAKIVLINFWASWCQACVVELPSLRNLANSTPKENLQVILVNLDEFPKKDGIRMLKKLKVDLPMYVDYEQRLSEMFDIRAIPLTIVLNSKRKIILVESGDRDWNSKKVKAQIQKWITNPAKVDSEADLDLGDESESHS